MSIFKNIKDAARVVVKGLEDVNWSGFTSLSENANGVDKHNLMDNNKNWVYVCVDKIAMACASTRLRLMKTNKDGEDEEDFTHAAIQLLYKPNKYQSGRDFLYSVVSHNELTGDSFWLKVGTGKAFELYPLNPKYVKVVRTADGLGIDHYEYTVGAKVISYKPEQMLQFRYPNPDSPIKGRGTLEGVADWVDIDNYATEFNRRFFLNGASFGGMIETEAGSEIAIDLIRTGLNQQHKGVKNAHKIGILPKGAKWVQDKMTPKDMEFSEADNRFRDKILAGFGVPKSIVGIVEDVNRANADSSNYVFMLWTVKPKMELLCDFLNAFYLPLFSDTDGYYFTFENVVPEDRDFKLREIQAGVANGQFLTLNEARSNMGLPPLATGGDVVFGNPFAEPLGSPEKGVSVSTSKTKRPVVLPKRAGKKALVDEVVEKTFGKLKEVTREQKLNEIHNEFIDRVTQYEKQLGKHLVNFNEAQKREVIQKLGSLSKGLSTKAINPADLIDKERAVQVIVDFATPLMTALMADEGTRALIELEVEAAFDPTDERIQRKLNMSISRMAKKYTDTTLEELSKTLNAGIGAGEGLADLTKRVAAVYEFADQYRAAMVARTETFSTANDAAREAYKQSDVVKTVRWHTAEDEMTCEFCQPLDGTIVGVSEGFFKKGDTLEGVDGGELSLDYESVQNPPLHPNCRCEIMPEEISVKHGDHYHTKLYADISSRRKKLGKE